MYKIGDEVETVNGVGVIVDIRVQGEINSPPVYLIRVSGVADVYSADEFQTV